ncbi:MAG: 2,3-cyclic 3-phosphodiesterase [Acidobacteriota bacterium]|jgi:2'-5' RNA ligase
MRLFVGVEIDDVVRRRAAAIADAAGKLLSDDLVVRWIAPENLHITLWFLGEVPDPRAASVLTALARPFDIPPFPLALGGIGAFPSSGLPRVVWLGVRDGDAGLAALHREIGARLEPLGFAAEPRPFAAHLTLGRVKGARPGTAPRAVRERWRELAADAGECAVAAVTVFRSRLSPRGAVHEALLRVPLQ